VADLVAGSPLAAKAEAFAAEGHAGQIRNYSGRAYIEHPRAVATLLREAGFGDEVVAAALLHDLLEDTEATTEEIRDRFGERVADLVEALSDDPSIESYERRKDALREKAIAAGPDAVAVYAADKLSNVSDLRALYGGEGEESAERFKAPLDLRLELWRRDAEALCSLSPPPPFAAELRSELDALFAAREKALHNT
jgi:(p)ppGpp synthase/HD superfamily hydrolase